MTDYDDLFDQAGPTDSVFADKGALDSLADPGDVYGRVEQQRQLATF